MEIHVGILSEKLVKRGYDITVLCAPHSELANDLDAKGIRTIPFKPAGYIDILSILRTTKYLRKEKYDIIHAHYSRDLWTLAPAVSLAGGVPIVFIKHIGTQKPKRDMLHKWIYAHVCRIIAISNVIANNVIATHPVKAERVRVIHHGVDLEEFNLDEKIRRKIRDEFHVKENEMLIGTIGRLQEGKGHLEFLDMAEAIHKEFPNTKFLIVGEATRGEEFRAEKIYERIRQVNLGDNLILAGFRKDIPAVLSAMDIFAFPSRAEAFGLVLIEAMAAGLPVVSTKSDGVLDIVQDEETGLLVERQNSKQLTDAVKRLIIDVDKRQKFARAGKRKIAKEFTMQKMIEEIEKIYQECMDEAR